MTKVEEVDVCLNSESTRGENYRAVALLLDSASVASNGLALGALPFVPWTSHVGQCCDNKYYHMIHDEVAHNKRCCEDLYAMLTIGSPE